MTKERNRIWTAGLTTKTVGRAVFAAANFWKTKSSSLNFLEYSVGDFDSAAFATYIEADCGYKRVTEKADGVEKYHNVYLRVSPANTDILSPNAVDEFIKETHEKYYARFKEYFGKELVGFFTDEPQYYRYAAPYTPPLSKPFQNGAKTSSTGLYTFSNTTKWGINSASNTTAN